MKTIYDIGERGLISLIRARTPQGAGIVAGIGDDCAVVRSGCAGLPPCNADGNVRTPDIVLKSDCVIAGRHFDTSAPPRLVGRKAVGRVLSDIAAMGAAPRWFLVDLVAPPETPVSFVEEVHSGMMEFAEKFSFALVGGDTAKGPVFELHVFGVGEIPRGEAVLRSGAKSGDGIFVTGTLGGSYASGKHLAFEPRVHEGQWLRGRANSMIDISDGLASELWHIADESCVLMELDSAELSMAVSPKRLPDGSVSCPDLGAALYDGEDFELLFTLDESRHPDFTALWQDIYPETKLTRIGRVTGVRTFLSANERNGQECLRSNVIIDGKSLPRGGFDHFRQQATE